MCWEDPDNFLGHNFAIGRAMIYLLVIAISKPNMTERWLIHEWIDVRDVARGCVKWELNQIKDLLYRFWRCPWTSTQALLLVKIAEQFKCKNLLTT